MSDVDGGAAAPADTSTVELPNPVSTEPGGHVEPEAKPEPKAEVKDTPKPLSAREALQKAAEKVEKDNAPVKTEAKTAEKPADKTADKAKDTKADDKPRGEHGHFASKDAKPEVKTEAKPEAKPSYTAGDPPARFTADVKQAWASLPENVRGEVSRMERELTQGYEKHKTAAERDASLNEFHEMARQSGKQLPQVVREYVNMENHLRKDLLGGLDTICQRMGHSLKDVAAHVLGQTPDQNASQQDATIRELKNTNSTLEQRLARLEGNVNQQRESASLEQVTAFSKDKPLFEVLAPHIADHMKETGNINLDEVYEAVLQKYPQLVALSPKAEPAASTADPAIDLSAQTEKGQKSIKGTADSGSEPARRSQPSTSIKDSIRRAAALVG